MDALIIVCENLFNADALRGVAVFARHEVWSLHEDSAQDYILGANFRHARCVSHASVGQDVAVCDRAGPVHPDADEFLDVRVGENVFYCKRHLVRPR